MAERKVRTRVEGEELSGTIDAVHKRYGEGGLSRGSGRVQPERVSTGSFMLDFALLGGVPHNRITTFVGERHSGKSTMSQIIAGNMQRVYPDQEPVIIDVEGTYDEVWAGKLGIDQEHIHIFQPESGEAAVDVADAFVHTKEVSLIIVDSIAALTPMKEKEDSAEDAHMALQARLTGSMIRKLTSGLIEERNRGHKVTVIFISQFRTNIKAMFGDNRSVVGGRALEASNTVQIIMKNKETMGKDEYEVETAVVNEHVFQITKNKMNAGPRTGEFRLVRTPDAITGLQEGMIDDASTLLAYAKKFNIYTGGGQAWRLNFNDTDLTFKNSDQAIAMLYEDSDMYWALRCKVIQQQATHMGMPAEFLSRFDL